MFHMKAYDVEFPMKEPDRIVVDMNYMDKLSYISGIGHPFLRFARKITYYAKCIRYGRVNLIFAAIKRKLKL